MFSYSYMYLILNTLKFKFVNEIFRSSFSYLNSNILHHSYINIWLKSFLKLLLDQVSDFSISWHVCHSFHIIYMYMHVHVFHMKIIQGSIACSCFNLNENCWDWKILADISFFFFFFSVSPNLAEISSCVTCHWVIHYFGKSMQTLPQ